MRPLSIRSKEMDEGLERKKNRDGAYPIGYAPMDWAGKQFGNLTVAAYDGKRGGKHY